MLEVLDYGGMLVGYGRLVCELSMLALDLLK